MSQNNSMKAIVCTGYQSNDFLSIKELPKPTTKRDEILVRIMSSTVESGDAVIKNADQLMIKLIFGLKKPRKSILGTCLAGIVESVGNDVSDFHVGDKIIASTGLKFGCHVQYIALNKNVVVEKIPENRTYHDSASILFGGLSALHYLKKMPNSGKMLIYGASGSVGTSMVQLAKEKGYHVTAVCSKANHELVLSLGANDVLDYQDPNWKNQLTQYDVVFDAVGKTKKDNWISYLNKGSFYSIAKGYVKGNKEDLTLLVNLVEANKLMPVIDRIYPMNQIGEAYDYVSSGRKKGCVILDLS